MAFGDADGEGVAGLFDGDIGFMACWQVGRGGCGGGVELLEQAAFDEACEGGDEDLAWQGEGFDEGVERCGGLCLQGVRHDGESEERLFFGREEVGVWGEDGVPCLFVGAGEVAAGKEEEPADLQPQDEEGDGGKAAIEGVVSDDAHLEFEIEALQALVGDAREDPCQEAGRKGDFGIGDEQVAEGEEGAA